MKNYKDNLFPDIDKNVVRRRKRKRLKLITERSVRISEEKICAFVIVILFLMVGSYICGYKKGGVISNLKEETDVVLSTIAVGDKEEAVEVETNDSSFVLTEIKDDELGKNRESSGSSFALQVVTYKNMSYAESEKERLSKMGYHSYIREQGRYKIVFVGDYSEQGKARIVLRELKKIYKDAFMKELKGGR